MKNEKKQRLMVKEIAREIDIGHPLVIEVYDILCKKDGADVNEVDIKHILNMHHPNWITKIDYDIVEQCLRILESVDLIYWHDWHAQLKKN